MGILTEGQWLFLVLVAIVGICLIILWTLVRSTINTANREAAWGDYGYRNEIKENEQLREENQKLHDRILHLSGDYPDEDEDEDEVDRLIRETNEDEFDTEGN